MSGKILNRLGINTRIISLHKPERYNILEVNDYAD